MMATATQKSIANSACHDLEQLCHAPSAVEAEDFTSRLMLLCNIALAQNVVTPNIHEKENQAQVNIPEVTTIQEQAQKPDHVENELLQTLRAQVCRFQHINDPFFKLLSHPVSPQVLENLQRFKITADPALLLWQIQRESNRHLRTMFLDILEGHVTPNKKDRKKKYFIKEIERKYSTKSILANYGNAKDLRGFSQLVALPEQVFEHLSHKKPRKDLLSEPIFEMLNHETNLKHAKWIILYLSGMNQTDIVDYCMESAAIICYVLEKYKIPYEPKSRRSANSVRNSMAKRVHDANQAATSSSGLATND